MPEPTLKQILAALPDKTLARIFEKTVAQQIDKYIDRAKQCPIWHEKTPALGPGKVVTGRGHDGLTSPE